jgi:hypothetical protein
MGLLQLAYSKSKGLAGKLKLMKNDSSQNAVQTSQDILAVLKEHPPELPPVLVLGMHNSGTSMLTEILHNSGVFFGVSMKHHESHFFTSFINDQLILGGGDHWTDLPLMQVEKVLSFESTVGQIIHSHWLIDYLQWGYDGVSPWGIKDPRLCVLLPLYLRIFPGAKVVHIRRNPEDVAASLSGKYKAGVGILEDYERWKRLTEAYTQRVLDYSDKCAAYFELSYEDFCRDPEPIARELFEFLDISFSENTTRLLGKVTPSRIGSYQRLLERRRHPLLEKFRYWISRR